MDILERLRARNRGRTFADGRPDDLGDAQTEIESLRDRVTELEEAKKAAVYAYIATHREGWETGMSTEEAWTRVSDCLGNLGLFDMEEMKEWLEVAAMAADEREKGE